jgi:EmrB/QacA subfamily drug resistance transporter
LNVALPTIVRDLHASSSELQWIVDAYAIVFAGLLLVFGNASDRVGRKKVFAAGLVLFALGSAAAAFSSSPDRLIAARAFMGIGAAAIMPSTLSILTNVFTDDVSRARAIGIWSGTAGLGVAIGPIAGGWLLSHYWWGSVFLVNVPIAIAGLIASLWLVPESRNPSTTRPDPFGAALSMLGLGLLLWGIIEAPNSSWTSFSVLASLGAAVVLLTTFILWERRCDHPMLQVSFFSSRRFSAAIASMGLVIFGLMGLLFLTTQWLQFSLGYGAFAAGVRVGPVALVVLVVAPLSSLLAHRLGTKPVVAAGMMAIGAALLMLSSTTVRGTYIEALPAFLLLGTGAGLAFAPSTESVMGSVPRALAGVGAATNSTALQVGGALGVGVLGSLLNTRYRSHVAPALAGHRIPASVEHLITGSLGGALAVSSHVGGHLGSMLGALARSSFVSGMDLALATAGAVVFAGALVVVAMLPSRAYPKSQDEPEAHPESFGTTRDRTRAGSQIALVMVDTFESTPDGTNDVCD